jgi:hypothetical protein
MRKKIRANRASRSSATRKTPTVSTLGGVSDGLSSRQRFPQARADAVLKATVNALRK